MRFENNTIFHVYNQGNNRQQIFFSPENYLFFLRKMREYVCPYADFLCYCLMPNHFHWLVYVRETVLEVARQEMPARSVGVTDSHPDTTKRTLNQSIGILLRSYARAINIQENRTGCLFREETKAKDGWEDPYLTLLHPNYGKVWQNWEMYGHTCFNYIHNNPVEARLSRTAENWEYSSAKDFAGLRNGRLCNQKLAKELLFLR